jgi:predicted phage tail protein
MPSLSLGQGLNKITAMGGVALSPVSSISISTSGSTNNRTITATWDAPIEGTPINYQVEISSNGGPFTDTQTVGGLTYDFTGLADGVYLVRVRAVYSDGNSSWVVSDEASTGLWLIPVMQPLGVV